MAKPDLTSIIITPCRNVISMERTASVVVCWFLAVLPFSEKRNFVRVSEKT